MEKNSKNYLIVLLVVVVLALTAYIIYDKTNDKKASKNLEVNNQDIENNNEVENNDTESSDNEESKQEYVFEKLNLMATKQSFKIGEKTYNLSKKADGNSQNIFYDNNKLLNLEGKLFTVSEVYIWHDLLVVIGIEMNSIEIYAFDQNLESLGLLSGENVGFYTLGQQGTSDDKNPYEFSEEAITIYESNINLGGEIISSGVSLGDITCDNAKTDYKNVAAEYKKTYKYENGKLTSPITEVNKSISSVVCGE